MKISLSRRIVQGLVLLAALGSVAVSAAVHDPVASTRLERLLAPLASLKADFHQTVADGEGYELQAVDGTMTVARPGKVHWQTEPPFEQLVVSDATTLWLYDKDLEQVTVRPFDEDVANTPAVLLIGKVENLDATYQVSNVTEGGDTIFTLVPRDEGALYQKITLTFAGETPRGMSLWDTLGQRTTIDFRDVVINGKVNQRLFRFKIPRGVDVLYDN
ncbi:MAG: outer membrane lipoprotein chaperone LolA [Porticoccaceae bacterium]